MSNLSLIVNLTNESPMDYYNKLDPITVKTQDILQLCGTFSGQAKVAAIIGLLLAIGAFFYFGRFRERIVQWLGPITIIWADKLILISIAICFAVVITRLYYGG